MIVKGIETGTEDQEDIESSLTIVDDVLTVCKLTIRYMFFHK